MELIFNFIIVIIGGFGAGVVTGLAGASAATIISPLLIGFSVFAPYTAITISLLTDVFASAASAYTYKKHGNINMKNGLYLSVFAVIGSIVGSYLSSQIPSDALGGGSSVVTLLVGISFFFKSKKLERYYNDSTLVQPEKKRHFENHQLAASIVFGSIIGLICGIVGAGGGMMILLILTAVLGYDTKTAVGTSVLIMMFTALFGGVSHLAVLHITENSLNLVFVLAVLVSSCFAIIGAKTAAKFANAAPEYKMIRIVSITFIILGTITIITKQIGL